VVSAAPTPRRCPAQATGPGTGLDDGGRADRHAGGISRGLLGAARPPAIRRAGPQRRDGFGDRTSRAGRRGESGQSSGVGRTGVADAAGSGARGGPGRARQDPAGSSRRFGIARPAGPSRFRRRRPPRSSPPSRPRPSRCRRPKRPGSCPCWQPCGST
jgi:hypothetical protein